MSPFRECWRPGAERPFASPARPPSPRCARAGAMATRRGLGRCAAAFWLALLFSACGLALLLGGALGGAAFADLLLYGGGLCLLFGLGWAVLWRVGNVEVPPAELQDDVGLGGARADPRQQRLVRLLRSLGRRVSSALSRSAGTPSALALEMQ